MSVDLRVVKSGEVDFHRRYTQHKDESILENNYPEH
jgi:hypothetical protein